MNITKDTFNILKNFATINSGIVMGGGNTLETISIAKNIMAKAEVTENFAEPFAIYDLNEFLSLSLSEIFEGAVYNFNEKYLDIVKDNAKTKYFYANPETIVAPQKEVTMPPEDVSFSLLEEDFEKIKTMASILKKPDFCVQSDGSEIKLVVLDKKDPTSSLFELSVDGSTDSAYKMFFKAENLKIIEGDYEVKISSKGISHFKNLEIPVQYWIALEQGSEYNNGDSDTTTEDEENNA